MQKQGELFEASVGFGGGADEILAFVFAHQIRSRGRELPQPYHRRGAFPPAPLKNLRQEPAGGVFSEEVDLQQLGNRPLNPVLRVPAPPGKVLNTALILLMKMFLI